MSPRWKEKVHDAFLDHNSSSGKNFDIFFLVMIICSIVVVMLDSVPGYHKRYQALFHSLEWFFTILFTIEYILRLALTRRPHKFVFSFFGIVDLLAILPTWLTIFLPATQPLLILRALRLLRIFRIFRMRNFMIDLRFLSGALANGFRKISIFFMFAGVIVIIMAAIMYMVEDPKDGFYSIPQCVYWAVTTITTVGYGDLTPVTPLGKMVANLLMIIGYAIIAVPTGIITTEMALAIKSRETGHDFCKECKGTGHDHDAAFCKHCGNQFES